MKLKGLRSYVIEIAKWMLIIWLFLPLSHAVDRPIDFGRVALGVVLFVIFSGKLLYDVVLFPREHQRESSAGKDILSMIGIVVGISLLVMLIIFLVGFYVINYMSENSGVR